MLYQTYVPLHRASYWI